MNIIAMGLTEFIERGGANGMMREIIFLRVAGAFLALFLVIKIWADSKRDKNEN